MKIINANTKSLCNVCYSEIPADVYEENGQVFIKKRCPEHGEFKALMEKDAEFYRWFIKIPPLDHSKFNSLLMPITYRCNMNCKYCFSWLPEGKDIPLAKIIEIAENFEGGDINLSGGEPTVREDLEEIITEIKKLGKNVMLVTNGLKLADLKYLRRLMNAGLDNVFFSLDSFSNGFYQMIKGTQFIGRPALDLKREALANLESEHVSTLLSATIYPGLNDGEMKDLFIFAFNRSHFINELRFRSCVGVGRNKESIKNAYFLSEMVGKFAGQIGVKKEVLEGKYLKARMGKSVIFLLKGRMIGSKFIIFPWIGEQKKLEVKIVGGPTVENIDLGELKSAGAYLCYDQKILKIFHGIVRDEMFSDEYVHEKNI
ncbi:MAG: radical SAM protein [Candidatus Saganbacteria bacterium]|nr:radical SAM protein [Candidatus Saganbacteria bacterium]